METIVAAAANVPIACSSTSNVEMACKRLTVSLPPPARHPEIIHTLFDVLRRCVRPDEQGFLTSQGRFVGRKEGMQIAIAAGQVDLARRKIDTGSMDLFSEDLW